MPNIDNIPTAGEKLMDLKTYFASEKDGSPGSYAKWEEVKGIMIEFAKLHVEAALKAVANNEDYPLSKIV